MKNISSPKHCNNNKINWQTVNKIAIMCRSAYGDLICANALMQYLKAQRPQASITLFVDKPNAPLLPYLTNFDDAIILPKQGNKYYNLLKAAVKSRKQKFDLAIISKGSPSKLANIFLYVLGAKMRCAYVEPRTWHAKLVNYATVYDPEQTRKYHHALEILHLVEQNYAVIPEKYYPKLTTKMPLISLANCPQHWPILFVSLSNNRSSCSLAIEKHANILNEIGEKINFYVLISCLPKDNEAASMLAKKLNVANSVYPTANFDEFMSVLNMADVVFVGDGGIMHMAAALDKQILALFGRTSLISWKPLSNKAICLFNVDNVNEIDPTEIAHYLAKQLHEIQKNKSRYPML